MKIFKDTLTMTDVTVHADSGDNATWIGEKSFVNSTRGRAQLEAECPADIVQAVEAVWGTAPTVTEPTIPTVPVSTAPTLEDRLSATEAAILALMG